MPRKKAHPMKHRIDSNWQTYHKIGRNNLIWDSQHDNEVNEGHPKGTIRGARGAFSGVCQKKISPRTAYSPGSRHRHVSHRFRVETGQLGRAEEENISRQGLSSPRLQNLALAPPSWDSIDVLRNRGIWWR